MADINSYLAHPGNATPEHLDRHQELAHWDRQVSVAAAAGEGITLTEAHWEVIVFLRQYYLEHGWPSHTDRMTRILDTAFSAQGGGRYLYRLFPGGPLAQGTRIARLPAPANVTNASFGSVQ